MTITTTHQVVQQKRFLLLRTLLLLGIGNWRDELGGFGLINDLLRRQACLVEFPIKDWIAIRRVENRFLEELIFHCVIESLSSALNANYYFFAGVSVFNAYIPD